MNNVTNTENALIDTSADGSVAQTLAIELNNICFGYNKNTHLMNIDNWRVPCGSQVFLYGASGSGKSTLLNLISGILTPQQGSINLLNQPFSSLSSAKRDAFRAQHIGVVFQEFNLIPFLTVAENIELAAHFTNTKHDQIRPNRAKKQRQATKQRMLNMFERLQLQTNLLTQRADSLSVGQRQRVSIARALINQPEILIADEPTSALDSDNRDEFMQLLLETASQTQSNIPCTVLFVSHDKSLADHFNRLVDIEDLVN